MRSCSQPAVRPRRVVRHRGVQREQGDAAQCDATTRQKAKKDISNIDRETLTITSEEEAIDRRGAAAMVERDSSGTGDT